MVQLLRQQNNLRSNLTFNEPLHDRLGYNPEDQKIRQLRVFYTPVWFVCCPPCGILLNEQQATFRNSEYPIQHWYSCRHVRQTLRDGGENRSPEAANLRGFAFIDWKQKCIASP
jgi:hypothetical protein